MNSLTLLILPLLVRLFLSHLLIIKILRKMKLKLRQLVRTIQIKANLFQEHPIRQRRKRLETLTAKKLKIRSINQRSRISVITVELQDIPVQIFTSGQPLNKVIVCSRPETRISFHPCLLFLEIFSMPSCSFRT